MNTYKDHRNIKLKKPEMFKNVLVMLFILHNQRDLEGLWTVVVQYFGRYRSSKHKDRYVELRDREVAEKLKNMQ